MAEFIYIGSQNKVLAFRVGLDGQLLPLASDGVPTGTNPVAAACTPSSRFLYVVNLDSNEVSQYRIQTNGRLVPLSPGSVAAGSAPSWVAVDPKECFCYVSNMGRDPLVPSTISQYRIRQDGTLVPLTPPTVGSGIYAGQLVASMGGPFVYVACGGSDYVAGSNRVFQYRIAGNGTLAPLSTPSVPVFDQARLMAIAVTRNGKFSYITNNMAQLLWAFRIIGSGPGRGQLVPLSSPPISAANGATSIVADANSRFVYVAGNVQRVLQFAIHSGGTLAPLTPPSAEVGTNAQWMAIAPRGKFAYVLDFSGGKVRQFNVRNDGTLASLSPPDIRITYPAFVAAAVRS